ncbi:MAG TPA: metallophosphoesterase family protein [Candidatus Hydrogenedens sp.]|nr:metallophosphoesterase family protein [Candidatus Hydrogenedens sp.]HOL18676.1 metallophosphoesterase family protein [Candidatus Hydrogenedens sp.]HPP58527.1 metallophosphoesterase family protein [Candidatus Hydrogenedens sp.]
MTKTKNLHSKHLTSFLLITVILFFLNLPPFADLKTPPERETPFPVTETPSQIVLTITETPQNSISIQWSTSTNVKESIIEWRKKEDSNTLKSQAQSISIIDPPLKNNPEILRWFITLNSLEPDTIYEYRVASIPQDIWSNWFSFKTAPAQPRTFSFIYLGDAQVGFEEWGKLLSNAIEKCPDCSFILMAGDLVNRGNERDDWDALFHFAGDIFARYPLVPTIGNHEYKSSPMLPKMYTDYFVLPQNGPENIPKEYCYSFLFSNAHFTILNANHNPEEQTAWLENQLAHSQSLWKFLLFHQPIYSSGVRRDNKHIRDAWLPIIDKYHVDFVFQGHDHSYWRTYPLNNNQKVSSPYEGTYYVIAFSGTKAYETQEPTELIEKTFTKTPTYQIITIETEKDNKLTYRSFDKEGNLKDEVIIYKPAQNLHSFNFDSLRYFEPILTANAF